MLYIVSFIVFFIVFISALFKIMHWPGAGLLLLIGIPIPFVLFLPVYIYQIRKVKNYSMLNFMGIIFGLIFLAVYSSMLSINISGSVLTSFKSQYYNNLNKVLSLYENPENNNRNSDILLKGKELCDFIDMLKMQILTVSGNDKTEKTDNPIYAIDNTDIASGILLNDEKYSNLDELKEKVLAFKKSVISSENCKNEVKELANTLFNVEAITEGDDNNSWERKEFLSYHLIIVLDALTRLESNVKFVLKESL